MSILGLGGRGGRRGGGGSGFGVMSWDADWLVVHL